MSEITDPMALDTDDYEKTKAKLLSQEFETEEPVDTESESTESESTESEEQESAEDFEDILLDDTSSDDENTKDLKADDTFEIIYKGERKQLTKDKVIELAQKGFSYHADMNRIAPHKKIVTLIEEDEDLANLVNNYVEERAKPKTSKLEDFDSEEAWLEDNLKRVKKAEQFAQVQPPSPGQEIIEFFQTKDPENYEKVLGSMGQYAERLSVAEYKKINESMEELEKFYDNVKQQVISTPVKTRPKQTFRARSGGGEPPRQEKSKPKVWEMSSKDFNKLIQKVKGY
jgi:hypothetical protein